MPGFSDFGKHYPPVHPLNGHWCYLKYLGKYQWNPVYAIPSNILFSVVLTLKLPSTTDWHLISSCFMARSIPVVYWITQSRCFDRIFVLGQKLSIDIRYVLFKDRNVIDMISNSLWIVSTGYAKLGFLQKILTTNESDWSVFNFRIAQIHYLLALVRGPFR